jgi:hydrogenase maturation protease
MTDPREGPLVIGVGTEHRHDDACGLEVVRALRGRVGVGPRLVEASADAAELLDLWDGEGWVRVVDAVRSGDPPGTRRVLEVVGEVAGPTPATSTHGLSLAEAIALGRALDRLPQRLTLYTIEAADVSMGNGLTREVARSVELVADALSVELDPPPGTRGALHA